MNKLIYQYSTIIRNHLNEMKRVCADFHLNSKREKFWNRKFSENSLELFRATHFRVRNPNSSQLNYAQNFHVQSHWFSRSIDDRRRTTKIIITKRLFVFWVFILFSFLFYYYYWIWILFRRGLFCSICFVCRMKMKFLLNLDLTRKRQANTRWLSWLTRLFVWITFRCWLSFHNFAQHLSSSIFIRAFVW